ncbi:MAG TPA: glycogen debranching enzyme, partial [Actinobacteria bacterium]|nr:glycogen debranching enzyme [Actinomycetota bacterium]
HKHNEANGEDGADGSDDNRSWNCGAEGETGDEAILGLRDRQRRNFLATLFCSQGVPMMLAGDEMGRTQGGNNNAYCQDNEVSWVNWDLAGSQAALLEFTHDLAALRREHPVFRRRRFFRGRPDDGGGLADIAWLTPSGREMTDGDWNTAYARAMMVFLNGDAITEPGPRGERVADDSFLILLSAHHEPLTFTLPGPKFGQCWAVTIDTAAGMAGEKDDGAQHLAGEQILLPGHSMMALRRIAAAG